MAAYPQLSHNAAFRRLWWGQTAGFLGFQVATLVTSTTAISVLQASNAEIGVVNAAQLAAFLFLGLPAGAWVDRWRKKPTMVVANVARTLALAWIPVAWLVGVLDVLQLIIVSALVGVSSVFFDVASQSLIPRLVAVDQISAANGRLEASFQVTRIAGPGIAGWLMGLVSIPLSFLAASLTYALSAITIARIPVEEPPSERPTDGGLFSQIREGIAFVRSERLLGPLFLSIAWASLTTQGVFVLTPVIALRILGVSPSALGTLLAIGALGGIAGAFLHSRVVTRLGVGRTIVWCYTIGSAAAIGLAIAPYAGDYALAVFIVANVVMAFFGTLYNITQMSLRQSLCPRPLLGRVNATFRFAVWGAMPVGALLAGWAADYLGIVPTTVLFIALSLTAGIAMALTPAARLRTVPLPHPVKASEGH